jgi:uncharacterized phage protein (TIGR02220 family)
MRNKEQPAYFAIIPANVRYADIPDRAKLLFGEITALAQKQGYCFASNSYFADAYNCTPQAISKHISSLEAAGFLKIEHNQNAGNLRKIWPVMNALPSQLEVDTYQPQVETPINQGLRPYQPQVKHISTSIKEQGIKEGNVVFDENDPTYLVTTVALERIDETVTDSAPRPAKKKDNTAHVQEIISYLNAKTGSKYRPTTADYIKSINARLKDGYTVDDFKKVIDFKTAKWLGDEKMSEYLRPSTLFTPKNFDQYLNAPSSAAAANTDAALKDLPGLDEESAAQYGRFIMHIQEHYPALWRSACRVFSQSEYFDYMTNKSIPGVALNIVPAEKRAHLARVMQELSASESKRKKYGTVWQAYETTMRALLTGKKVEI